MYGEKLCFTELREPKDAYEWSFVAVPAQPRAGSGEAVRLRGGAGAADCCESRQQAGSAVSQRAAPGGGAPCHAGGRRVWTGESSPRPLGRLEEDGTAGAQEAPTRRRWRRRFPVPLRSCGSGRRRPSGRTRLCFWSDLPVDGNRNNKSREEDSMNVSYEGIGQWAATFACRRRDRGAGGEGQRQRHGGQRARRTTALTAWCCPWPETAKPAPWPWAAW